MRSDGALLELSTIYHGDGAKIVLSGFCAFPPAFASEPMKRWDYDCYEESGGRCRIVRGLFPKRAT